MTYATRQDIISIYGAEFLVDLTPEDVPDADAAVDRALEDASSEIDGYLSARYTLPLGGAPRVLRRPCVDIAAYVLANSHTRLTDTIEKRYEEALVFLGKIAVGKAGLGVDEPSSEIAGSQIGTSSGAAFSAKPRIMGRR